MTLNGRVTRCKILDGLNSAARHSVMRITRANARLHDDATV